MSSREEKLIISKQRLMHALGDQQTKYFSYLKQWFRQKWTKEEFDIESRKLLDADKQHLHNQFFHAILNKVGTLALPINTAATSNGAQHPSHGANMNNKNTAKKRKRTSRPTSDRATFEPVDVFDYLPDECTDGVRPPTTASAGGSPPPMLPQRFAVQELFLPDAGLVMGRLLVGAWEIGLVTADDTVSDVIVLAVQMLLKNIISAILMRRKNYRVTCAGTYFYDVGHPLKDPTLCNTTSRQQIDDAPIEIDKNISLSNQNRPPVNDDSIFLTACEEVYHRPRRRINIVDLYNVLQDRQIVPAHSVHAINVERISQMLN